MEPIPEDPEARRAWLEGWAAQQPQEHEPQRQPGRHRIRMTPSLAVELLIDRLDRQIERIFDRRLDTTTRVYDVPETGPVDGVA